MTELEKARNATLDMVVEENQKLKALIPTCEKLVAWLYRIRANDENLVIEQSEHGFNLCDALGVIAKAKGTR
jgi:hypothetical protein